MAQILVTVLLSLALVFTAGVVAFGPSATVFGPYAPWVLFGVSVLFSIVWVRQTIRAASARNRTQELTMQLETANIKLTQLDRLKSEFLSFASHQIKAPMTVIKGYATLIMDGSYGPVADQVRDVAEKMKLSADRMIDLVNMFLDLRRIEEGHLDYHFEPADLGQLVASVVDEMQELARHKHLALSLAPLAGHWNVNADVTRLRQVIQNLVDNAIKYTETGSVTVSVMPQGDTLVHVSVTDTGRGIPSDLLPRLFEQFSRDESVAREIAGTGLGLYIARQIVQAHHGKVWAQSPGPGKGSTFIMELPVIQ
ncbi:MAG TPA: HAMP domain-containing sensor histidine kinase [Candidatus Paceibacterota bacterium]|nr:HAMP domain-containing sensor histidine kinase [Candidatus Paceibacterota bacterium]